MINSVTRGYGIEMIRPTPASSRTAPEQAESSATGDTVSFSEEAVLMSGTTCGKSSTTLLEEMPLMLSADELEAKTEEVRDRITALFLENDIPTDPPAELYVDTAGAVRVSGDHPYKDEIEAALAEDDVLSNDFRLVSAQTSLHEAGEEYMEFLKAYEQDPYAAVARFGYLFSDMPDEPYVMTIGGQKEA